MSDMTESPANQNKTDQSKRWPLYLIIGMVAFVLISGYLLSPRSEEAKRAWIELLGTTNKGILLNPPIEILEGQIVGTEGENWLPLENNTWKLLVVSPGQCEQQCVDRLSELHAMRIRLNRAADRLTIGLLSLSMEGRALPKYVAEFHDMNLAQFSNSDVLLKLQETNMPSAGAGSVVLMMNPVDVFMMAYDSSNTGVEILEDLEHLLDLAH